MQDNIEITDTEPEKDPQFAFKLVMVGNSGVGKTSLVQYEIQNTFKNESESTIIFNHLYKNYSIFDKIVRLQIWDLCGQEEYQSSIKSFYKSSLCNIIVFSLDDLESFNMVNSWIEDIKNNHNSDDYILVLIGNKTDLEKERVISKEKIEEFCKDNQIENYYEASAKTGENVHEIFKDLVRKLFIKFAMQIVDNESEKEEEIKNNSSLLNNNFLFCYNKKGCFKCCFNQ
jgi:small GTP-binding protein